MPWVGRTSKIKVRAGQRIVKYGILNLIKSPGK
jgi:hypothetical protein